FNRINWLPTFSIALVTILLVIIFDLSVIGAFIALISGPLIMFIILLKKNKIVSSIQLPIDWDPIKRLLSLGVTYAITLLVINLNYRLDIILLDKLSTSYEVGIYSKGASITQFLWHIPMIFSTI